MKLGSHEGELKIVTSPSSPVVVAKVIGPMGNCLKIGKGFRHMKK